MTLQNINISILNNLNYINNKLVIITDIYSYINSILISFILVSLICTFQLKATTIYKVLGLLLLNIFTPFSLGYLFFIVGIILLI